MTDEWSLSISSCLLFNSFSFLLENYSDLVKPQSYPSETIGLFQNRYHEQIVKADFLRNHLNIDTIYHGRAVVHEKYTLSGKYYITRSLTRNKYKEVTQRDPKNSPGMSRVPVGHEGHTRAVFWGRIVSIFCIYFSLNFS